MKRSHSHFESLVLSLFVGRYEFRGLHQGVALLIINVGLTLAGGVAGFSVGHAEQVICANAAVRSGVAGNGGTDLESLLWFFHTEELSHGCLL